jgi:ABC-2 type transport system ATP-binding protein
MIQAESLLKSYGTFEAVKDLTFSAGPGVLGFLGPNGAGKTTVMRMLSLCHYPTGGELKIGGVSVEDEPEKIKNMIGYLSESNPLYADMSPAEYLGFAASARLIPRNNRRLAAERVLALCGLEESRNRLIGSLSKGYRQRLGLAQALIHDPDILILDEPASGLDPNQIIEMRSLIRELGKNKTVILSTHILQEAEAMCSGILILDKGRVSAQGTPEEIAGILKNAAESQCAWELCLKGADAETVKHSLPAGISDLKAENQEDGTVRISFVTRGDDLGGEWIFDWAVSRNCKIVEMNRKKMSLEDIFVKLTGGEQLTGGERLTSGEREKER